MNEPREADEETLVRLLRDDLPPARDPLFRIKVLERRERRRFRRELALALTGGPIATVRSVMAPLLARITKTLSRAFVD
jgi:hypothetical protein